MLSEASLTENNRSICMINGRVSVATLAAAWYAIKLAPSAADLSDFHLPIPPVNLIFPLPIESTHTPTPAWKCNNGDYMELL